jgi:hypothetical protein
VSAAVQRTGQSHRARGGLVTAVGFSLTAVVVVTVVVVLQWGYDLSGALILAPLLVVITLPLLLRQSRREGDPRVLWFLLAALGLKLTGAVVSYFVSFHVYGGIVDATGYDLWGRKIAEQIQLGDFDFGLGSLTGINFIRVLTGVLYSVTGPTRLGGYLVFSWIGFLGLFLFYRAFHIAVPEGRLHSYGRLVFLLPSLLFWPSTIGKEAWMLFALGLGALGAAQLMVRRLRPGILFLGTGLWLASLVRPHVAGLMALAMVGGYMFQRSRRELGVLAPIAKGFGLAALLVLAAIMVVRTDRFLQETTSARSIASPEGIVGALEETSHRTGIGESRFAPSVLDSPARAPVAALTVLFRPHLLEVDSAQSFAAALETAFLLIFTLVRTRWWLSALGSIRRQPYVAFAVIYVGLFIVAFSAIANFGLLARERVQVLPLFLALLCIPPRREEEALDEPPG